MARRRALLTDRERELIADEEAESQRYVAVSRVRTKIQDELSEDIGILKEHHSELFEELEEVVCGDAERGTEGSETRRSRPSGGKDGVEEDVPTSSPRVEEHALSALSFPGGVDHEEGVGAILAARDYLREHGPASMKAIVTNVAPEHPLKYDPPEEIPTGERYRGAWWRRVVKPGLEALDDVDAPNTDVGESDWKYVGTAYE